MRRTLVIFACVALASLLGGSVYLYLQVHNIRHESVTDDVFVLHGLGGNVGVLRTEAGPVVVDTMTFRSQGDTIREAAAYLAGEGSVQAVINTHYHLDHTHGNPAFSGAKFVATQRTHQHMLERDGEYWTGDAAGALPNIRFEDTFRLSVGGKTVELYHLGRGHTDGDLVVLFVEDRVLHAGDLLFHRRYPNIDLEAGGSIREWAETLDRVLELDFDKVIPGHGAVTDADGVREFQGFLRQLWEVGLDAAARGASLEETLATEMLTEDAGYAPFSIPFVLQLDREFVLRRAWEEANGVVGE